VGLDWHGHDDRGLGLANALSAIEAGAERVHATALGVGERVGNTPLELLLATWHFWPYRARRSTAPSIPPSTRQRALGIAIPDNHPLVGANAFRTATGVHAAAIVKALARRSAGGSPCTAPCR